MKIKDPSISDWLIAARSLPKRQYDWFVVWLSDASDFHAGPTEMAKRLGISRQAADKLQEAVEAERFIEQTGEFILNRRGSPTPTYRLCKSIPLTKALQRHRAKLSQRASSLLPEDQSATNQGNNKNQSAIKLANFESQAQQKSSIALHVQEEQEASTRKQQQSSSIRLPSVGGGTSSRTEGVIALITSYMLNKDIPLDERELSLPSEIVRQLTELFTVSVPSRTTALAECERLLRKRMHSDKIKFLLNWAVLHLHKIWKTAWSIKDEDEYGNLPQDQCTDILAQYMLVEAPPQWMWNHYLTGCDFEKLIPHATIVDKLKSVCAADEEAFKYASRILNESYWQALCTWTMGPRLLAPGDIIPSTLVEDSSRKIVGAHEYCTLNRTNDTVIAFRRYVDISPEPGMLTPKNIPKEEWQVMRILQLRNLFLTSPEVDSVISERSQTINPQPNSSTEHGDSLL